MPIENVGLAAASAGAQLAPWKYSIRDLRDDDLKIEVCFCGICHSDIHTVHAAWSSTGIFPVVPGHEFTGIVVAIGDKVTLHKVGDRVGVGCLVSSCGECGACQRHSENHCTSRTQTYNARMKDGEITYGGYGKFVVVRESFVLRIPDSLPLDKAAPLLCAGITTYSAAVANGLKRGGLDVAVLGLGGLGHMAVQWAKLMGNRVTVLTRTTKKTDIALKLGADAVIATADQEALFKAANSFDIIMDTVSQKKPVNDYMPLLKAEGTMVTMGAPPASAKLEISAFNLIVGNKGIRGSLIGGIKETQEMLDYAAANNILPWIELINGKDVNEAYRRCEEGDVQFRFVMDIRATHASS
eukprot:Gregarina_sp_Poly_1__5362@NODE_2831_length_1656_cov_1068_096916_g1785_i0_p1_GENE_NODE_2831_length_1656_cov_1068_096916_g1785_i0NODE_2831_length_1656_cov_1068_096916_g1785_i0_p1_ORF_typecomplete_len384_score58_20ADH_N/PF08240_12/1_4e27ADH_zinc_N/PF00107_26/2_3e22Glu_dehyd_C/PF16912_5/3_5e15AlaDh_PNT_C/PF01262_21/4_2e07AlaDh_PNT_C/PF01262_21/4_2e03ADH_zinc_N_2/PF13602_6/4_2e03ADH_zinc_N_2/PF13602_6/3_3e06Shikimate_DH/PF01488_20/0_00016NAD_binding_2/PF03446_15/0_000542Hacid_dh_C/PF02826_19/0_0033Ad